MHMLIDACLDFQYNDNEQNKQDIIMQFDLMHLLQ